MPTELPEGLQKALEIVGGQRWPEGDEDGLDRMSEAWSSMQRSLEVLDRALQRSRDAVSANISGAYADAHSAWIDNDMRPTLEEVQKEAENYANLCKNTSADIQYAKAMIIAQLAMIAATLAFEWLPGIGQAITAAAAGTARLVISQIMKQVVFNIATHAAGGAALMTSLDASIQGMQMLTGERTEWNADLTKGAALGGALGGAMGGALSGAARGVASNAAGKNFGEQAQKFTEKATGKAAHDVAVAGGQGVGELGGDLASNAALGGKAAAQEGSFTSGMLGGFSSRGSSKGGQNGQETGQQTTESVNGATNVKTPSGDAAGKGLGLDGSGIATQSDGDQSAGQSDGQSGQNSSGGVQTTSTSDGAHSGDSSGNQDSSGTHSGDGQNSTTTAENTGQQQGNSATAQHSGGGHGGSEQNNTGSQHETSHNNTGGTDGRPENSDVDGAKQHGEPDQFTDHQSNSDPSSNHGPTNNDGPTDSPNRFEQSTPDDHDRPGATTRPEDTDQTGSTQHDVPDVQQKSDNPASHDGSGTDPGSRADSGGPDPNTATDRGGDGAPGGPLHNDADTRTPGQEPSTQHTPDDTANSAHSPSNASAEPNTVLRGDIGDQPAADHTTTPESAQSASDAPATRENPANSPSAEEHGTTTPVSHNGSETTTAAAAAFGPHAQHSGTPAQPPAPTNAGNTSANTPGSAQSTPGPAPSHQSTPPPVADPTNRPSTTSNPNANAGAKPGAAPGHPSTSSNGPAPHSSGESRPTATPTPEASAARPETASAGDNKVSHNSTDGESSAPPPNRPEGSRNGDNTGGSQNERIDSYRPDPARGEKEKGRYAFFDDGRPPEYRTNPPSEHVLLRGDNGETFGVTPVMVDKWAADNGVNIPSKGGIRDAISNRLYPKDPSREPDVYRPDEAQRFRDDLKADSARQHADEQHREMEAANKTADWIAEKYPPDQFNYVGLGRSPAPVVAALTSHGHDTRSVPLSDFRPAPHDPNSILNRPFEEILKQPHHPTPEQHRMLDQHFEEFLGDLPGNKDVLLIDYTQGGLSLVAAQYYLQHHLNGSPNAGSEVHALAMHQDIDESNINKTHALTVSPGTQLGKLREMLWDRETANQRQQWQDHFQKFSLGEDGPLRQDGPLFGHAFKEEAFDKLSEHGSYKILNQDPSTFEANRPRRDHEPTPEDEPRAYDVLTNAVRAARDPHAWDDPDAFFDARSQFSDDTYFSAPSTPASPDSPIGARNTGGEASAPSRDAGRPNVDGESSDHTPNGPQRPSAEDAGVHTGRDNRLFTSPDEWGPQRDNAPVSHHRTERFDPTKATTVDRGGNIDLAGNRTRIDHDLRRFQDYNGNWVREYTVTPDLAPHDKNLTPDELHRFGQRVKNATENNFNGRYRLPDSGDQLHIRVEPNIVSRDDSRITSWFDDSDQQPYIKVHNTGQSSRPTQLTWDTHHPDGPLAHEIMHLLGLGEGYTDPNLVLRHPEQDGVMGRGAWDAHPGLTEINLADLERISDSGPVIRDHPLQNPDAPHHAETNNPDAATPTTIHNGPDDNQRPHTDNEASAPSSRRSGGHYTSRGNDSYTSRRGGDDYTSSRGGDYTSRRDRSPEWLYRGDTRPPEDIFPRGFSARGTNYNLEHHLHGGPRAADSGYISTTRDPHVAHQFKVQDPRNPIIRGDRHYSSVETTVYQTRPTRNMVDINAQDHLPPDLREHVRPQQEYAARDHIPPRNIHSATTTRSYHWPGYDGRSQQLPGHTPQITRYAENPWYENPHHTGYGNNRYSSGYGDSRYRSRYNRYGEPRAPHTDNTTENSANSADNPSPGDTTVHNGANERAFSHPDQWGTQRDNAPVSHHRTERFDPAKATTVDHAGNIDLAGNRTRIDHHIRRFQDHNGNWIREYTVTPDLARMDPNVTPEAAHALGERVRQSVDTHLNGRYRLPDSGDQLHIRVEPRVAEWNPNKADPSNPEFWAENPGQHPYIKVYDSSGETPETANPTQLTWGSTHDGDLLAHEVLHFLGLGEGYTDPDLVLRHPEQPGAMGRDIRSRPPFLVDDNLAELERISNSGPVIRDHPNDADPAQHQHDSSTPTPDAVHTGSDRKRNPDVHSESAAPRSGRDVYVVGADHLGRINAHHAIDDTLVRTDGIRTTRLGKISGYHGVKPEYYDSVTLDGIHRPEGATAGNHDTNWKAWYLAEHPDQAAGYGINDDGAAGAVVRYNLRADTTIHDIPAGRETDTDWIKRHLGVPHHEPLMDYLGERGAVLRTLENDDGDHELIIPWNLAEHGRAKHFSWLDRDGQLHLDPDGRPEPNQPRGWGRDYTNTPAEQHRPHTTHRTPRTERRHPNDLLRSGHETRGTRYLSPHPRTTHHYTTAQYTRPRSNETRYLDNRRHSPDTTTYYPHRPLEIRTRIPWNPNRGSLHRTHGEPWAPPAQATRPSVDGESSAPPPRTTAQDGTAHDRSTGPDHPTAHHPTANDATAVDTANHPRGNETAADRPQDGTAHQPLRGEADSRPLPRIAVTDEEGRPALTTWQSLPAWVRGSRSLGSIASHDVDASGLGDLVRTMLPEGPRGTRPAGVERVEATAHHDFESFLDRGRSFPVRSGKQWYEAHVRAVFPHSPESTPDTTATREPTQNIMMVDSGIDSARSSTINTTRTLGSSIEGGPLVGPYGRVGLRAPLARPSVSRDGQLSSSEQHDFRTTGGSSKADAPVRFEVQLTDSDGATVPQRPETPTAITGRASLQIPHDLGTFHDPGQVRAGNPEAGWAARLDHPATEAVVLGDDRFHDVAGRLHPSITRLGAPGRQELEHFLSSANVRTNFGQLLQGWVLSPDLVSAHGNRGSAVQMTASASEPELVGITDAGFTRAHDSASSSSALSSATKSGFEGNLAAGGSAISGSPLGGSAMLTAGRSAHSTATNKVGGQHTSKVAMQVKGDVGLYEAKVDLTVATRNGEPISIPATAHMRIGLPEAAEQGLPVPHGTRASIATPTAEKRFPPPYLAAKAAMGNVKVSGHGPANRALPHVQEALSALDGIGKFLPEWGDAHTTPERTGKHVSDEREKFNNQRKLTAALSPGALRAKWDALLGQGTDVQLKKRGMFTNDYVNVRVRARIGDGEHLGEAGERSVRASASTAPTTGTSTTLTKGWSAGVEGRMLHLGVVDHHRLAVSPTASLKYTSTTTRTQSANPTETHAPVAVGSPKSQIFRHDTELDVEITSYSRPRAWVKRLTPGSPTRTVPEPQVLARTVREGEAAPDGARALPPISGKTTLWVPDGTTGKHDQGQFRPGEPTSRELGERDPRSIRELLNRGDRPGRTEGLHVEAVTGTEFLRDVALGHLHRAADGDGVLGLPGSAARKEVDDFFSPEHIAANLARLSDHGGYVDGLHYDRRFHDRIGSVGTSYELKNPTLVSVADDISTENSTTGGPAVGETTGKSRGWDLDLSLNHTARPENDPADGASYVSSAVAAAKPWSRSTTRFTGDELSGTVERTRTTPEQARTALVRMDADVTLIAESQQRNVLHSTAPQRSGSVVTLPGGAFVRVDEEQARALGVLPDRRAPEPQVPESERLAPPRLFGRHQPSSIGLSMVDTAPDMRGLLGDMRAKLGDRGTELLPDSVLDDAMRNQHKLVNLTSPGHVQALQDSALDGGITTLAHAPGFFGRTTYWSQLRAQLDGEPEFLDVVHDGVEMDHTVRGSTKHTAADGKTSGWSVGLRGPSGAAPGTGNPDISSTAGTGAGAEVSAGQQHSTGTSSARTSKASRLSTASGPAARYQVPIRFELVTGRGDEPGTVVSTETRPMRMRVHANNVPTAGHEPAPVQDYSVQAHERAPADARPEGIRAWQQEDAAALPHTAVAEALRGSTDLREGARAALANAGASKRITGLGTPAAHALHSALSPEMLQAQLVGGRTSPLRVPHLHAISLLTGEHADVEVHRRLSRPRLVGLSDHVTMADERAETSTRSAENSHTGTGSVTAAPGAGRTILPDPDPGGGMISSTGAEHARARGDVDGSSGGSTGTKTNNVKVAGRSGLVEYDADYRIVATSGGNVGVVDVHVPASTHVRMDESGLRSALHRDLPDSLRSGQDRLERAADDWREAEVAGGRARHASDDRINENAPRRDAAHRALAARRDETAAARDRLARAEQRVEQARSRSADEQARLPEFQARARAHVDELALKADSALARVWSAGASRAEAENAVRDLQQRDRTDEAGAARQSYADALVEERQAAADHARWDAEFRSATAEAERAPAAAEEATAEFRTAEQEQHRSQESLEQARAREGSAHRAAREAEDEVATHERELDAAREQVRTAKKAWLSAKTAVDDEIREFNGAERASSGPQRAVSEPEPPLLDPIPEEPETRAAPAGTGPSTPDSTERANPEPGAQQRNGLASFLHPERNP